LLSNNSSRPKLKAKFGQIQYTICDRNTQLQYTICDRNTQLQYTICDRNTQLQYTICDRNTELQYTISDRNTQLRYTICDRNSQVLMNYGQSFTGWFPRILYLKCSYDDMSDFQKRYRVTIAWNLRLNLRITENMCSRRQANTFMIKLMPMSYFITENAFKYHWFALEAVVRQTHPHLRRI